jgi:hypothetical protein
VTELEAEHPPYRPRFYEAEVETDGRVVRFVGGDPVVYPGEVASILWEPGDERATWAVEPAPGLRARLLRLRYRLIGERLG